ncbi:hypothetical protein FHT86_001402 [Rhizobium sp. BK313]|jgi:hypothetical protein|nr:hypothetical protein [Rhizobium sp. BK313]
MGTWEGPGRIRDLEIHAVDRLLVRESPETRRPILTESNG